MKKLTIFLFLLTTAVTNASGSAPEAISDALVDEFINIYRDDPEALIRFQPFIKHANVEQMARTIKGLNTTHFTYLYPITISGHELPEASGMALETLSLMAVRGGQLRAIPFQFDEFNHEGMIWVAGKTSGNPLGELDVLDDLDELVFMFRDASETRYDRAQHAPANAIEIVRELVLEDANGQQRYAYLVTGNNSRSAARYVNVDVDNGVIETTALNMQFDTRNLLGIHHIASRVGPHAGENVFDNISIALSTGILNANLRFGLDSKKNIRVVPVAASNGPVRNTIILRVRIWYLGLPTLVTHDVQMHVYEQGMVIPLPLATESVGSLRHFVSLLKEPRMDIKVDFRNLDEARTTFHSRYDGQQFAVVDGKMSEYEIALNYARMPGDWLHLDSNRGWQLFFVNGVPLQEGGLFDQFLRGTQLNMVYRDNLDLKESTMRGTGVQPRLGFRLEGMPRAAVDMLTSAPKVPNRVTHLGEALMFLADPENHNRFRHYDRAANGVLADLTKDRYPTPEALADAFINDMRRLNYHGVSRAQLEPLIRQAMLQEIHNPGEVEHGKVLKRFVALAEEQGINLRQLHYATFNLDLWFPDQLGGSPADFYQQTQYPPRLKIPTDLLIAN